ncbi:MAG: hypothetical protein JWN25_2116 [Verrucomicrobiales bacterium]|nr:hypothetical protein [Verrucomicrobiales bacterium]
MARSLLKPGLLAGLLITGSIVMIWQDRVTESLRRQNQNLAAQNFQLEKRSAGLQIEVRGLNPEDYKKKSQLELLQLRNEVGMLRGVEEELAKWRKKERDRLAALKREDEQRGQNQSEGLTRHGQYYIRTFNLAALDAEKIRLVVERAMPASIASSTPNTIATTGFREGGKGMVSTNNAAGLSSIVSNLLKANRVELDPRTAMLFDSQLGVMRVMAITAEEVEKIQSVLALYSQP